MKKILVSICSCLAIFISCNLHANKYVNKGNEKYKIHDYYGAIEDYNKALIVDPNYAEAF